MVIDTFFLHDVQISVGRPHYINVFQWSTECFFSGHMELNSRFIVMAINEINKVDACQLSSIIKFWLFVRPFLFFLLSERLSQFWSLLQATHYLVWWSLEHLSVLPDHRYTFGGFSSNKVNFGSPFQESYKFLFASTLQ